PEESQETGTAPITAPEIDRVRALPHRDAVVEPADPPCGLGQPLEILRRQGPRQVGGAQLLERLAPRVTLERLTASGKLVFPAVPHRLFSDDSGGCVTLARRLDRTIARGAVPAVERGGRSEFLGEVWVDERGCGAWRT